MNRVTKKLVCAAMAGIIGTGLLAGCSKTIDGTKALLTCGEDTVTMGTGNMMLRMNQAQMEAYYGMMGGSTAGIWGQDAGDGKTYAESTKDMIIQQLKNMVLLKQHAKDYDVTVTEDEEKSIEESAKAFVEANTEEALTKLAVTQDDIENLLTLYTYQEKMYEPMTKDVDTNVEDSEAQQSKITYCRFSTSDKQNEDGTTTPLTDEEKQVKKDQAQQLLDKLNASADPAAADMDALAKEIDEGLSAFDTTFDGEDTVLDEKLKEAALTLTEDGQVYEKIVESESAYFVVRMDSVLDREATDKEKESIVQERKQEVYNDLLKDWEKDAKFTVNKKEWKKAELTDYDKYIIKQPETEEKESSENTEETAE